MKNTTIVPIAHHAFSNTHPGVPKYLVDRVEAFKKYEKGELDTNPIIKRCASADTYYQYSDSSHTYKLGVAEELQLREDVATLVKEGVFTEEDGITLLSVYGGSNSKFNERFPYALVPSTGKLGDDTLTKLLYEGTYDYEHVLEAVELCNSLLPIKEYFEDLPSKDYTLHTKTNRTKNQELKEKIKLPDNLQPLVYNFEAKLLNNKRLYVYIRDVLSSLDTYDKLLTSDDHVVHLSTFERTVPISIQGDTLIFNSKYSWIMFSINI